MTYLYSMAIPCGTRVPVGLRLETEDAG
jgi:hypothetical protein